VPPPVAPGPTAAPVQYPRNWGGAGAAYNSFVKPPLSGWISLANFISDKGPVDSFSTIDITSARTKPFTSQTSVGTGLATVIRQFGPVTILGFGVAGASMVATNLGGAFAGIVSAPGEATTAPWLAIVVLTFEIVASAPPSCHVSPVVEVAAGTCRA
jgi:hypothetical protein